MDECVLFQGYTNVFGYGQRRVNDVAYQAHVFAWIAKNGSVPEGYQVCHTCDNPACINVEGDGVYVVDGVEYRRSGHLWLGTQAANMRDMAAKGRGRNQSRFTADDIRDIRRLYRIGAMSQAAIGRLFGADQPQISRIVRRETFVHIP